MREKRESASMSRGGAQRKSERENLKQAPHSAQSPMWSSILGPWDHDLSQNQELDSHATEPPVAPRY